jgi:uncharacterized surface protein with fasciclin (FAS1) repeats
MHDYCRRVRDIEVSYTFSLVEYFRFAAIFGPNDEAFVNIGLTNVSEIPADLIATLTNHVVLGDYTLEYLMGVDCLELDTLGDQKIKVSKMGDMIMINEGTLKFI